MAEENALPAVWNDVPTAPLLVEQGGWGRNLTPMNQFVPVPPGFEAPNWAAVPEHTPVDEIRPVYDDNGKLLYKSVSTSYVTRMLKKLFPTGYREETIQAGWSNPARQPGEDGEYVVALQIVAPGMFGPVMGVGSNKFQKKNSQDTDAKTIAAAYTAALKNAAKKLNIGRDFDEDDPELVKLADGRRNTITMMYEKLIEAGRADEVRAAIREIEPTALIEGGGLLITAIEFDHLEPVQKELQNIAVRAAKNGSTAPKEAAAK